MKISTRFFAALAAVTIMLLPTPARATAGWSPDAVMVMPLEEADMTAADRELLDALGAQPGDVLDVEYAQVDMPLDGGSYEAALFAGTEIEVPTTSPLFAPAGQARADQGEQYPEYGTLLAYDKDAGTELPVGERPDDRVWNDEPNTAGAKTTAAPDLLVWASDETVTTTPTVGSPVTWARIGVGLQDVWVDARRLTDPGSMPAVKEARDANLAEQETASEPASETPTPAEPQESASSANEDGDGGGVPVGLVVVVLVAVVAGAMFLARRLRKASDESGGDR